MLYPKSLQSQKAESSNILKTTKLPYLSSLTITLYSRGGEVLQEQQTIIPELGLSPLATWPAVPLGFMMLMLLPLSRPMLLPYCTAGLRHFQGCDKRLGTSLSSKIPQGAAPMRSPLRAATSLSSPWVNETQLDSSGLCWRFPCNALHTISFPNHSPAWSPFHLDCLGQ